MSKNPNWVWGGVDNPWILTYIGPSGPGFFGFLLHKFFNQLRFSLTTVLAELP